MKSPVLRVQDRGFVFPARTYKDSANSSDSQYLFGNTVN